MHILHKHKDFFETDKRYSILYGGAGSGKSYAAAQKIVLRCLKHRGFKVLVLRKVARTVKESVYALIKQVIEQGEIPAVRQRISPARFIFPNTSEIIFAGVDDPEKLKSITGINSIWIEEATELTVDDFNQINLRLRNPQESYRQILLTFNPTSTVNWVYKYFFDTDDSTILDNLFVSKSTYLDNTYLPADYKAVLETLKISNNEYYSVYALGDWGTLGDTVYRPFDIVSKYPLNPDEVIYGLDFGWNNPTALIRIVIKDYTFYLDEILYSSQIYTRDLIPIIKQVEGTNYGNVPIYCDSAEPDRISELQQGGCYALKAKKEVKAGINFVQSIHSQIKTLNKNRYINEEVLKYKWKVNNGEALDEPEKRYDHALDAIRYALFSHLANRASI